MTRASDSHWRLSDMTVGDGATIDPADIAAER
jgi:hypothetical protein